jgi:outer membrane protein
VQQGLELELEAALGEFDAARAQIEARRATVAQAQRALELVELRFSSGLATQLDVSSSRLLLQQARVNEAQALYGYVDALARLERVSGGSVPLLQSRLPGGD